MSVQGGDETWRTVLTLPNILKEFNPAIIGFSTGDGPAHARAAGFNVAEGGATSSDLTKVLVKRIKADKRVDFHRDWKVFQNFVIIIIKLK
jgi:phospholipase B1, membrane-associated